MSPDGWFEDAADARKYLAEVGRLWAVWVGGLGALALSRGGVAFLIGGALLLVMFVLMKPLQQRVQTRFGTDSAARKSEPRRTLSARDKALRQLTYGSGPFAEALSKGGLPSALKVLPWLVIGATLVAGAFVAVAWFES